MVILGVDVGGTFTDFYLAREGRLEIHKQPSTPANPAEAILAGVIENGWQPDEVVHGTTVATNTVLERRGGYTQTSVGMLDRPRFRTPNRIWLGMSTESGPSMVSPW